jgi:hypothetical protein
VWDVGCESVRGNELLGMMLAESRETGAVEDVVVEINGGM